MKDISLSTNDTPFVGRLKNLIAALFHFLDWFTPAHPFITDKRARTFFVSFTILFFELLCIRWIPSYVRYLSYFNNFLLLLLSWALASVCSQRAASVSGFPRSRYCWRCWSLSSRRQSSSFSSIQRRFSTLAFPIRAPGQKTFWCCQSFSAW